MRRRVERARLAGRSAEGKQSPEQRRETPAEPSPSSQLVAEAMTARREADRYREADFAVNNSVPIPDLSIDELSSILEKIVQIEGPLHEEELARRMTSLWDLKRTGSRITDAVTNALRYLVSRGRVAVDEGFCAIPGVAVRVRRREDVNSSSLRKADCLPPAEIRAAILLVVEQGIGVRAEEACEEALHLFGFKAISENLRTVTARQLSRLVEEGTLQAKDGRLYVAPKS